MLQFLDDESYSIMILCMIVFSGAIAPIVKKLYKPRKYTSFRPRTILHSALDSELRLLACIYREYNTSCLLNLLEVSNPSLEGQICFYLVHLVELEGRTSAMFVAHRPGKRISAYTAKSEHIINAFSLYQQQNTGALVVNPYTSIAPYETIHQDVCELALDKRVAMVIIPFHKRFTIAEDIGSSAMRIVNRDIMENSPCSVGILVDRGSLSANSLLFTSKSLYRIGMLFVGGPDDREALAYAMRMAGHPNVRLTVIHFVNQAHQRGSDNELIDEYKLANLGSKSLIFKEEQVRDSLEIITRIQTLEESYELVLVGRSHESETVGFTEWIEFQELGYIGDMLVSSDSKCKASLLVVQQQAFVGDDIPSPFMEAKAYAVVNMGKEQSVS